MLRTIYIIASITILGIPYLQAVAFNCSEPPNFSNFDVTTCCRSPEMNLGAAPEKCDKYIRSLQEKANQTNLYPTYAHVCFPECIYRETGSLVNKEINLDFVRRFLKNSVSPRDKDVVPVIVRSFEVCLNYSKQYLHKAEYQTFALLPEGCSPYSSMIYGCVNAETFLHCPAKMWKNERNCNLAKSFAQQCNPLPHVPLPRLENNLQKS